MTDGLDFVRGEAAAENARSSVAALMGADRADIALIPSVSAAAGLVAAQLGPSKGAENVVIGEQEYSSNHFPWRQLTSKGYDVRQVPFHNGGLEPEALAGHVDAGTRLVAFSGVQSATGHRSDIAAISALAREVGAMVFVDASQMLGAVPCATARPRRRDGGRRSQVPPARRPWLGYAAPARVRDDFVPSMQAGGGAVPLESFFGLRMYCRHRVAVRQLDQLVTAVETKQRLSVRRIRRTRSTEGTPARPFSDRPQRCGWAAGSCGRIRARSSRFSA
jgi:hypothetical protein